MSNFTYITTLPVLPDHYINEGMAANFQLKFRPCSYRVRSSFFHSKLATMLRNKFGTCWAEYISFKAGSYYDWHCDFSRKCALNWLINTSPRSIAMYRELVLTPPGTPTQTILFDMEEINYTLYHPVVLNTHHEHAVINPGPEDRILLSVTVENVEYYELLEWLSQNPMDTYD